MFTGTKIPPTIDLEAISDEILYYLEDNSLLDPAENSKEVFDLILEFFPQDFKKQFPPLKIEAFSGNRDFQSLAILENDISEYFSVIGYSSDYHDEEVNLMRNAQTVVSQVDHIMKIIEDFIDDYVCGTDG